MRDRRQGRTILIVLAILAAIGILVFLGQIFAQEGGPPAGEGEAGPPIEPEGAPPGGMEGGPPPGGPPPGEMAGGPGMAGEMGGMPGEMGMGMGGPDMGRAAAGGLEWTDTPMPEELTKTYDEYLEETGQPEAMIPDAYLYDSEGEPKEYTENQWAQLTRIYAGRRVAELGRGGKPGYGLATRINRELAVKEKELAAVREVYEAGLGSFTFEIGYPQVEHADLTPGTSTVPVRVGVIVSPRPGIEQRYPSLVYRKLRPFDHYGEDRELFRIVDYEGGIWNPKEIYLWRSAVSEWNSLWSQNSIRLTLYDVTGDRIVSGTQSAGHSGGICAKLVHPDDLNYAPLHETIFPPQDHSFEGGNVGLDYTKGWYYSFSFSIPIGELAALDRAEAVIIGAGGVEGARGATQAAPPEQYEGAASRAAMQSGAERAMGRARTGLPMMGQQVPPGFY